VCSTMQYPRLLLSNLRSDSGSAVSDFVLLVVPASLLCLPLIELFGIYQGAIVKEQVSYEIARFASLADISLDQALDYKQFKDPLAQLTRITNQTSCSFLVSTESKKSIIFLPQVIEVPIQGRATCEK
jgi:hypothetical protein